MVEVFSRASNVTLLITRVQSLLPRCLVCTFRVGAVNSSMRTGISYRSFRKQLLGAAIETGYAGGWLSVAA